MRQFFEHAWVSKHSVIGQALKLRA